MRLATHNLTKSYQKRRVVDGVSVHVERGKAVGLLGPNGAGKTTTFYMMVGIVRPDSGTITVDDTDITREPIHKRARYGIGYLPQEASVFRKLSVRDNLLAILQTREDLTPKERDERANALLKEFGLERVETRLGSQLSGGERRRVEIARCLCRNLFCSMSRLRASIPSRSRIFNPSFPICGSAISAC